MDTVYKVCDAMENVTVSAATVVPRCFVCGMDTIDEDDDKAFDTTCGDLTTKFASHNLDQFVEENSVCIKTEDLVVTIPSVETQTVPLRSESLNPVDEAAFRDNESKESSWASIDGQRQPRFGMAMSDYSAPVPEFQEPNDDDKSSHASLADLIDEENGSDNDPINMTVSLDKIGLGLFGLPLQWTHPVKKKSSWSSSSSGHKTSSTATNSSGNESSGGISQKNSRDDFNSLGQETSLNGSLHTNEMTKSSLGTITSSPSDLGLNSSQNEFLRELPSFGKSREFRSFGSSNRSLEDQSALYSLKPTYISADESKQLQEESSRYKFLLHRTPSDRSSTAGSSNANRDFLTTTIPYSSLSKDPLSRKTMVGSFVTTPSKRTSFEKVFRNPFPKKLSSS